MTPVTPILLPAKTARDLFDAGYDSCSVWLAEGSPLAPDDWEPIRPRGDGWVLHAKGTMDDGGTRAVWARPLPSKLDGYVASIEAGLRCYNAAIDATGDDQKVRDAHALIESSDRALAEVPA